MYKYNFLVSFLENPYLFKNIHVGFIFKIRMSFLQIFKKQSEKHNNFMSSLKVREAGNCHY